MSRADGRRAAVHDRDRKQDQAANESTEGRLGRACEPSSLQNSSAHLPRIVENSPDLIATLDPDATIRFINRTLPQFTREEMLGTSAFDYVHGADLERYKETFHHVVTTGEPREMELASDGQACWLARFVPVRGDDGTIETILVIATDVTDRKLAEAERRPLESQVQHAQKLQSLGALASGIAHDFNNLLTGILGSASLAVMKLPPDSPAAEQLSRVLAAAEKATELTRKMLAYAGKGEFVMVPSDLNQIIEDVLPLVRTSVGKMASIQLVLAPNLPPIDADGNQLQQVVVNLLSNAAEALASEIVVRTGAMAGGELSAHPSVFLEVRDDGSGMDEETRTRIFDPFFSTKSAGRGLGLSAVAGIVTGHGGKIRVESAPQRGATFTVLFSARRPDEPDPSAPHPGDERLAKLRDG